MEVGKREMSYIYEKLEIELPYDPAIPLLGIYTKETRSERDTCTPMFIAALFILTSCMTSWIVIKSKSELDLMVTQGELDLLQDLKDTEPVLGGVIIELKSHSRRR